MWSPWDVALQVSAEVATMSLVEATQAAKSFKLVPKSDEAKARIKVAMQHSFLFKGGCIFRVLTGRCSSRTSGEFRTLAPCHAPSTFTPPTELS